MLLDHRGQVINGLANHAKKKADVVLEPRVGDSFGQWAGRDIVQATMPGGGILQFDLSKLTLADFRSMRQHYQLGASLNVLSFIMHQIDWHIECENKEIATFLEHDLLENWTPIIRAISQAFWAGYGPSAVNYKNASDGIRLASVKDLVPEECRVRWRKTEGWNEPGKAKPMIYHYDGLYHNGHLIPTENSFWYPLLMENGDHYGRKLLRPAFPAWFFSNLIHLFANRYFERFGEPLPIGRADFDADVDMGNQKYVSGKQAMETIINQIRSRSAVTLPSSRDPQTKEYDFDIQYLESQMRGADFERYLNRLDEEMSLSVFTPILLFRTADVGSYNLGQAHLRIFQQMLNAIAGDLQFFIQNYLVDRLRVLNFGQKSPQAKWIYRKQGQGDMETYKLLMSEIIRSGRAEPDYEELGAIVGLKWNEIEQIVEDPAEPTKTTDGEAAKPDVKSARAVAQEMAVRAAREFGNGKTAIALGYRNRFRDALRTNGLGSEEAEGITSTIYGRVNTWLADVTPIIDTGDELAGMLQKVLDSELASV